MKYRLSILAVACLALFSPVQASGPGDEGPEERRKIGVALDLSYEGPEEGLRVGQKVNAMVENPTKLSRQGVTARKGDKVVVTLTSKNTFTLLHTGSGRSFSFKIDGKGNVTPVR